MSKEHCLSENVEFCKKLKKLNTRIIMFKQLEGFYCEKYWRWVLQLTGNLTMKNFKSGNNNIEKRRTRFTWGTFQRWVMSRSRWETGSACHWLAFSPLWTCDRWSLSPSCFIQPGDTKVSRFSPLMAAILVVRAGGLCLWLFLSTHAHTLGRVLHSAGSRCLRRKVLTFAALV